MKKSLGLCSYAVMVLVAVTAFLGNAAAQSSYSYSRTVAIDHTKIPNTDQVSFPVLFNTTDASLKTVTNGGHVTNANGYDIIFTSDSAGTQQLNHEIESYNASTGQFTAWVQVPTVSHTADTVIYLFYGNNAITTSLENKTGVWDSNYQVVQHFPSASTLTANDSTSNGINGTLQNSPTAASGQMGGAGAFVGSSSQYADLGNNSSLWNGLTTMTWSAWIYPTANPGSNWSKVINRGIDSGWNIDVGSSDHPGDVECAMRVTSGPGRFVTANNYVDSILNTWNYVTCAYNGSTFSMYINGALVNSASATGGPYGGGVGAYNTNVFIGTDSTGHYFTGNIDEVRVSNTGRSADWIAAEYANQSSPGTFYTLGSEQFSGQSQISTPTFNPPGGTYSSTQTVTISTTTSGASIRYTTDGSTPSAITGIPYSGPIVVSATGTVKAVAYASGMTDSSIASAAYTITGGDGYGYSRTITISHTKIPNTDQTSFPVLFNTTDALLKTVANGGHVTNANGYDIIFTSDSAGTQKLNHEIESYNASSGQFTAWVQVPTLSHSADTVIYLFYGNNSITASQENKTGVWDSNYQVVQHFPSSATLTANDSTSNGINGTLQNSPTAGSGQMGGAGTFAGSSSQYIDLGNNSSLWNGLASMTWSAWIYPTVNPGSNWSKVINRGIDSGWNIDVGSSDHPGDVECDMRVSSGVGRFVTANNYVDSILNSWNYVTCAYDGSTFSMYINGVLASSVSATGGPNGGGVGAYNTNVFIGTDSTGHYFTGGIDEVRVSNAARSADWIAAEYANQSSPMSFYALGSEQFSGQSQVSTPTFNPPAGTYTSTQTVTISTATSGASIRYTTDGSTPSETVGTLYAAPVSVSVSETIKAIAYMTGTTDSTVASAAYVITPLTSAPFFTPNGGTYASTQTVTISTSTAGASIRYTTNGSTPTSSFGTFYTGPVTISTTSTLKAIAYASGYADSSVSSADYSFVPPPSITSVTPTTAIAGDQITVVGSGFGAVQSGGQVWLGTAQGAVLSWSDTQIVATVAPIATSGTAQVFQNGVFSNSIPFTVDTPSISSISPASGGLGTSVTIQGSSFGPSQGLSTVILGSVNGQVVTWNDTQIVATVASGSVSGVVRIQRNGAWSNAKTFTVPGGTNTLVPNVVSMVVGDTRTLQALTLSGQPATGLTWTSGDTNIVSLSTDDPPILTALAPGHTTITAGTASADITAYLDTLPLGTTIWSDPGNGSGVTQLIPAVPSDTGVADVFAFQSDGTVQAITSDGVVAWTANAGQVGPGYGWALPDFQGGLVADTFDGNTETIKKFDGLTGQLVSQYVVSSHDLTWSPVVHTDGTIFVVMDFFSSTAPTTAVVGIDPATGNEKFRITQPGVGIYSDMIVAGDGYAYHPYYVDNGSTSQAKVIRVSSSGAYTIFDVSSNFGTFPTNYTSNPSLISNGDDGVLLSWNAPPSATDVGAAHLTTISSTGISDAIGPDIPNRADYSVVPLLQRQDGTFVGTIFTGGHLSSLFHWVPHMVAFDASGNVWWDVPNEQPMIATDDNGVIGWKGTIYDQNGAPIGTSPLKDYMTFDQNGNLTGQEAVVQSWRGNTYQQGSIVQVFNAAVSWARTLWAQAGGNSTKNGTAARPWEFKLVWQNNCATEPQPCGFTIYPDNPQNAPDLHVDASSKATRIKSAALTALKKAFEKYPVSVNVTEGTANTGDHQAVVLDGYVANPNPGHTGEVLCGSTVNPTSSSKIYYRPHMENAQWALPIQIRTQQDAQAAVGLDNYVTAIGTGIGNTSAHEIGHQFFNLSSGMEDHSQNTYNGAGCATPWNYGVGPIQWETVTQDAWKNALGTGWHK